MIYGAGWIGNRARVHRVLPREKEGQTQALFHGPFPDARQFRRRITHIVRLHTQAHNRYIIFIIRTRDTRSRAGSYDAPVSVNRI